MVSLPRQQLVYAAVLLLSLGGCRGVELARPSWDEVLGNLGLAGERSETRRAWEDWASANLADGDILFVLGDGHLMLGLVNFSRLCSQVAESNFSHVAIAAWEGGQVWVYDTGVEGPKRSTFGEFISDRGVRRVAVKRLRLQFRHHIPEALAFCRQVQQQRPAFDRDLRLDNDRLYCTELVELAFRSTGLPLSEPVRIDCLPGFDRVPRSTLLLLHAATNVRPEQAVFLPGNDRMGIWSCPHLELVLGTTDVSSPPLRGGEEPRS